MAGRGHLFHGTIPQTCLGKRTLRLYLMIYSAMHLACGLACVCWSYGHWFSGSHLQTRGCGRFDTGHFPFQKSFQPLSNCRVLTTGDSSYKDDSEFECPRCGILLLEAVLETRYSRNRNDMVNASTVF